MIKQINNYRFYKLDNVSVAIHYTDYCKNYEQALRELKVIRGLKYNRPKFTGGILFYCCFDEDEELHKLVKAINKVKNQEIEKFIVTNDCYLQILNNRISLIYQDKEIYNGNIELFGKNMKENSNWFEEISINKLLRENKIKLLESDNIPEFKYFLQGRNTLEDGDNILKQHKLKEGKKILYNDINYYAENIEKLFIDFDQNYLYKITKKDNRIGLFLIHKRNTVEETLDYKQFKAGYKSEIKAKDDSIIHVIGNYGNTYRISEEQAYNNCENIVKLLISKGYKKWGLQVIDIELEQRKEAQVLINKQNIDNLFDNN